MDRGDKPLQSERAWQLVNACLTLTSILDLDLLLEKIIAAAASLTGAESASIFLYDSSTGQLRYEVGINLPVSLPRGAAVPENCSIAGWVASRRQSLMIPGDEHEYGLKDAGWECSFTVVGSILGVPMISRSKLTGVLEAVNKQDGNFDEEDREILAALGAQAASAVENAVLFQQSDYVSEMIHEMRTPISSISTAAHLLVRRGLGEEQQRRMLEIIQIETNRLTEMTSSYLDLAQLESGRTKLYLETLPIREVLLECVEVINPQAAEKGQCVRVEIPDGLPFVKADRSKLKQVVLNLLSNAAKYSTPEGCITLTARGDEHEVVISVADTGTGIDENDLPHIFDKFYRAPGADQLALGTGLGLSITKHIIEVHQGRLEVESEIGQGTVFRVYLPLLP